MLEKENMLSVPEMDGRAGELIICERVRERDHCQNSWVAMLGCLVVIAGSGERCGALCGGIFDVIAQLRDRAKKKRKKALNYRSTHGLLEPSSGLMGSSRGF